MAITYEPKIKAIFDGRCTQTIRKGDKVNMDDEILFHDWAGLPYRSKWLQRKRITVKQVFQIVILEEGLYYDGMGAVNDSPIYNWTFHHCSDLAKLDFIDPPTGEALRDVLFGLNGAPKEPEQYQIIRW